MKAIKLVPDNTDIVYYSVSYDVYNFGVRRWRWRWRLAFGVRRSAMAYGE